MTAKDKKDIYRYFLKDTVRMKVDFYNTDRQGIAARF